MDKDKHLKGFSAAKSNLKVTCQLFLSCHNRSMWGIFTMWPINVKLYARGR